MAAPPIPRLVATVDAAIGRTRLQGSVGAGTTEYDVYRVGPSGVPAYVRGAQDVATTGPAAVDVVDYEMPFGVEVEYVLVARNVDGETPSNANSLGNPGVETNLDFWSGTAFTRSSTKARSGAWSIRMANTGGGNESVQTAVEDVLAGSTLEVVVYVNPDATVSMNLQVNELDSGGGLNVFTEAPPVVCPANVWTKLTYAVELAEGTTDLFVYVTTAGSQPTTFIYVDDAAGVMRAYATLDVDDDWLVDLDDARNTGPVLVESLDELAYAAPQGVHRIIGRRTPIVTSDLRWTPTGRLVLTTATVDEARRVRDALGSSGPLLFRSTLERGVGNLYLLPIGDVVEQRMSRIATEPSRRWLVDFVEIDRPAASLYAPISVTWAEVLAGFSTWADVLAGRDTWGDLLYDRTGLPDSDLYSREPAFPPRDV